MEVEWNGVNLGEYLMISSDELEKKTTPMWTGPVKSPIDEIVKLIGKGDLVGAKRRLRKMYKISPEHITLTGNYNVFNALVNIIYLEEDRQERTRLRNKKTIH